MNKPTTAAQAIDRSIRHNEIVTLPEYNGDDLAVLLTECEDWTETHNMTEFWGSQGGSEWRVHMPRAEQRC